jgi:hypothetical protein
VATLRTGPLALAILAAILAGCAANPSASPTPIGAQPSYSCTPEAGGTPQPCYEYEYQRSQAREKLYAEAEVVLRKILSEDERVYRSGGATQPTPVMLETASGESLSDTLAEYRSFHDEHSKAIGGEYHLAYIHRVPGATEAGSVATLEACVDSSTVQIKTPTSTTRGSVTVQRTFFSVVDGTLKSTYLEWKEVESC